MASEHHGLEGLALFDAALDVPRLLWRRGSTLHLSEVCGQRFAPGLSEVTRRFCDVTDGTWCVDCGARARVLAVARAQGRRAACGSETHLIAARLGAGCAVVEAVTAAVAAHAPSVTCAAGAAVYMTAAVPAPVAHVLGLVDRGAGMAIWADSGPLPADVVSEGQAEAVASIAVRLWAEASGSSEMCHFASATQAALNLLPLSPRG